MSLGLSEIVLILIVVLILFGGKRIPELAKALGRAQYEYKKARDMLQNEAQELKKTSPTPPKKKKRKTKNNRWKNGRKVLLNIWKLSVQH